MGLRAPLTLEMHHPGGERGADDHAAAGDVVTATLQARRWEIDRLPNFPTGKEWECCLKHTCKTPTSFHEAHF